MFPVWAVGVKYAVQLACLQCVNCVQNFRMPCGFVYEQRKFTEKSFPAFFCFGGFLVMGFVQRIFFAVLFKRIKFTLSCFWNFRNAFVGHFVFLNWLNWLSLSEYGFSQDSLTFSWNSLSKVVPILSLK